MDLLAPSGRKAPARAGPGRPGPLAQRARHRRGSGRASIVYAPDLDGAADPGEIVWAWVPFEEGDGRGKDRPLLVVGRSGGELLGLMLSSQHDRAGDPDWTPIGSGGVGPAGAASRSSGSTACWRSASTTSGARARCWTATASSGWPTGCAAGSAGADGRRGISWSCAPRRTW